MSPCRSEGTATRHSAGSATEGEKAKVSSYREGRAGACCRVRVPDSSWLLLLLLSQMSSSCRYEEFSLTEPSEAGDPTSTSCLGCLPNQPDLRADCAVPARRRGEKTDQCALASEVVWRSATAAQRRRAWSPVSREGRRWTHAAESSGIGGRICPSVLTVDS